MSRYASVEKVGDVDERFWERLETASWQGRMVLVEGYTESQKRIRVVAVRTGTVHCVKPSSLTGWEDVTIGDAGGGQL